MTLKASYHPNLPQISLEIGTTLQSLYDKGGGVRGEEGVVREGVVSGLSVH